jgi:hypothetical protein
MPATKDPAAALDKIRSDELRREAVTTRSQPHVVVVELNLPQPKVEVMPSSREPGRGTGFSISTEPSDSTVSESRVAKTRHAIEQIIGRPPERFFPSSGSFVVTATGKQLQQLVELPYVAAIWPNTRA